MGYTTPCGFAPRCAFSPTAVSPTLASLFYQNLPLFPFVLDSFLQGWVGDDLWYTCYGFSARLGQVQYQCQQGCFLLYSLLGMLPKVFEELELQQSVAMHHDETMAQFCKDNNHASSFMVNLVMGYSNEQPMVVGELIFESRFFWIADPT